MIKATTKVYVLLRKTILKSSYESGVAGVFSDLDMAMDFAYQVINGIQTADNSRKFVYDEPPQDRYNKNVKFRLIQTTTELPRFVFECTEEILLTHEPKEAE